MTWILLVVSAAGCAAGTTDPLPSWNDGPSRDAIDRVRALAASGEHGILEVVMETHAGMTAGEFAEIAREWLSTARHPRSDELFTSMV